MAKKRKPKSGGQSTATLASQAGSQLQAGRYREAMEAYKQLLKREPRAEWRDALAEAYLGRAEQLAAKDMYKEAAALWENMAALCGERRHVDRYVEWLLQAERIGRGVRVFVEADEAFRDSPGGQRLAVRLAGLLVCGDPDVGAALPADSPLLRQRDVILAAMEAYCRGDDAAMKESLKTIAFRSPYRDLRLILQALAALATEPAAAAAALDRVDADSPFAGLAKAVRTALLDGAALLEAAGQIDAGARELVLALKGWDESRIALAGRLSDARQASPKALFRFALGSSDQLDAARLERFCRKLLPHHPEGLAAFEKQFGPLPPLERERIQALGAERSDQPEIASAHWQNAVELLTGPDAKGDDALAAALILRHVAELNIRSIGLEPWESEVQDALARSLELDPEDKPTYLKLLEIAREQDDHQAQDQWVERAVRQFPGDPEILMAAGLAAYRRRAYKKAAGFAEALLERDPINPHARNLLISCRLAHARKQIKAAHYELAERELAAALAQAREPEHRGSLKLYQGFLALLTGAEAEGEALLAEGWQDLGGGLPADFRFLVAGRRLGIAQRTLTRHHKRIKGKPRPATAGDMTRVAEVVQFCVDDGVKVIPQILDQLKKPLKAAARLEYAEQELLAICAALHKAGHHALLREYADAGLARFHGAPRLLYYAVFGRTRGELSRANPLERAQLRSALDRAEAAEDHETADLIADYLELLPFGFPPLPGEPPEDVAEALDELMDFLDTDDPRDVLDFIAERLRDEGELPPLPMPKGKRK